MRDLRVTFPDPCSEKWETMTPAGCHRACAKCDKIIHDLSHYQVDEVAMLLLDNPDSCVRASVDACGVIATKPEPQGSMRRILTTIGASAGLLISQPALSQRIHGDGVIVGRVSNFGLKTRVVAEDAEGNSFHTRVRANGQYKIKNLIAGTYTLHFIPDCGDSWTVGNIVVDKGEVAVPNGPNNGTCIVVGRLELDEQRS